MSESPARITPPRSSSLLPFQALDSRKKVILGIALIAISMIVTGGGLYFTHAIVSYCLIGMGGCVLSVLLLRMIIQNVQENSSKKTDKIETKQFPEPPKPETTDEIVDNHTNIPPLTTTKSPQNDEASLRAQLEKLYDQDQPFLNSLLSKNLDAEIRDFLLLSHATFMSLTLETIFTFSPQKMDYVYERLLYLEKHPSAKQGTVLTYFTNFSEVKNFFLSQKPTLATLHSLEGWALFEEPPFPPTFPSIYLSMLTTDQLRDFLQSNIFLGPTPSKYLFARTPYTYHLLRNINPLFINRYLKKLPVEFLRQVPPACFSLPNFPWSFIPPSDVGNLLSIDQEQPSYFIETNEEFIRAAFKGMDMHTIHRLAPFLSSEHLALFPEGILSNKDFPRGKFPLASAK